MKLVSLSVPSRVRTSHNSIIFFVLFGMLATTGITSAQVAADSREALLSRAIELEKSKDYAGAEGVYKQVLSSAPDDPELLKRLGLVCQQQGKFEESIEV
ncbi:MAG TPA: tetratricopeptide repeat protein, partial [Candidatus Hodarchaeales archaeon]|nr:tetratricopeptide repeat protein [Candidatus Hodarchaeales archaeon]